MTATLLQNGRIIDPASGRDETGDLWIVDGRFADPAKTNIPKAQVETIACDGLVISPGLIDIHVHLREPGQSAKETIASGTQCAAKRIP